LLQEGAAYQQAVRVSEEGNFSLPFSYLQDVKAQGYTSRGLERRLADRLKPPDGPLRNPRVTVFILEYRNRTWSIIAGVRMPGIYPLQSYDMTLFDALAQAGGVNAFREQYWYVVRRMTQDEWTRVMLRAESESLREQLQQEAEAENDAAAVESVPEAETVADEQAVEDIVAPPEGAPEAPEKTLTDLEELQAVAEGRSVEVTETPDESEEPEQESPDDPMVDLPEPPPAPEGDGKWKYENGIWVPVDGTAEKADDDQAEEDVAAEPEADEPEDAAEMPEAGDEISPALRARLYRLGVVEGGDGLVRIIRIDGEALLTGDPSQNVVMRNADKVNIPEPPAGEWYIDGEIVRRGVYSLTGRKITLLQAVAAAGGLTEVAVPQRTELVRRVSEDAEEIIYVDLAKIARGEAPDFFLQPNDLIRVGSDQIAIYLAVLRNSFRATWGFGLVYDQNFADIYPFRGGIHPLFGD
jgi:protein involved in polysaccharide export with SLBB domain